MSKRGGICGLWCTCCTAILDAMGGRKRKRCWRGDQATRITRAYWARSTNRHRTGWRFTCSHSLRTGTVSFNCALWESGFDPLARTCRFMLTEEAHHMFVGETGVSRILQRTCEVMHEHKVENPADVRALGVIDLETMQRYLNFHYSVTLDLYGSDVSSNAANYYTTGLKGRYDETKIE